MKKDYTNIYILNALNLPIIKDLDDLSNCLALSKTLIYLLSQQTRRYYNEFNILKRDGTERTISAPSYSLKLVQRWILNNILCKIPVTNESMAYRKGKKYGIKSNAATHRFSLYILEMDLENFFNSIHKSRVFYLFKNLGYNNFISNIFANLCTLDEKVPQGAVTSPYISNIVCYKLDKRLKGLCAKRDIVYTRYADDLTFSCDNKETLKMVRALIEEIVEEEGFTINRSKTRFLSPSSHKKVTGITINDSKIKASKDLKMLVRTMIHRSIVTKDYRNNEKIRGYISFINSIEDNYLKKITVYINRLTKSGINYDVDIVNSYNSNKLYKNLDTMVLKQVNRFNEEEYYDKLYNEKLNDQYLMKLTEAAATLEGD